MSHFNISVTLPGLSRYLKSFMGLFTGFLQILAGIQSSAS